jgi:hypothetical protein
MLRKEIPPCARLSVDLPWGVVPPLNLPRRWQKRITGRPRKPAAHPGRTHGRTWIRVLGHQPPVAQRVRAQCADNVARSPQGRSAVVEVPHPLEEALARGVRYRGRRDGPGVQGRCDLEAFEAAALHCVKQGDFRGHGKPVGHRVLEDGVVAKLGSNGSHLNGNDGRMASVSPVAGSNPSLCVETSTLVLTWGHTSVPGSSPS